MFGLIQVASRFRYFVLIPVVLVLLLAMGCGSPSSQHKVVREQGGTDTFQSARKPSYPSWFWNTPGSGDALFAVGMSEKYERSGASEKYATANGVKNLARSLSAQVKGGRGMERNGGRLISSVVIWKRKYLLKCLSSLRNTIAWKQHAPLPFSRLFCFE